MKSQTQSPYVQQLGRTSANTKIDICGSSLMFLLTRGLQLCFGAIVRLKRTSYYAPVHSHMSPRICDVLDIIARPVLCLLLGEYNAMRYAWDAFVFLVEYRDGQVPVSVDLLVQHFQQVHSVFMARENRKYICRCMASCVGLRDSLKVWYDLRLLSRKNQFRRSRLVAGQPWEENVDCLRRLALCGVTCGLRP